MVDHSLGVGADLHTWCTKCKADRWHIVVAKVGTQIKRVECKTCGSLHNLRGSKSTPPHKKASAKPKTPREKTKAATETMGPDQWQTMVNDREAAGEARQPYNFKVTYGVGNLIDHPKFGVGVVLQVLDNNLKAEIAFREGVKRLVMGRT